MIPVALDIILAVGIQFTDPRPEEPQSVHKLRKAHRVLPAGTKLSSPKEGSVNWEELEWRGEEPEARTYIIGSDTPYTGKSYSLYPNGQKEMEGNFEDDKKEGPYIMWHSNGQKRMEGNYKDGEEISAKYWNGKGEPVDSYEEALK